VLPACLRLADEVFPRVRAHAARRLVDAGWSQARAGSALGLSQAMVSKHLTSPPPSDPLVERLADELANEALRPTAHQDISPWCGTLTQVHGSPEAEAALQDFLAAEQALLAEPPLRVVPQVGLNLAVAPPGAGAPAEVLAFPGRLVEAGGRLVRPAPPAFGGSGHLARVLLALRDRAPQIGALANVRGGADVVARVRRLGWAVQAVDRPADAPGEAVLLAAIAAGRKPVDAVHDPGAVGLEACLYVAGPDAQAVSKKILALDQALVPK
jgi:predicted fused transcriptional regulator/phosphomethylpyrimidine kinase